MLDTPPTALPFREGARSGRTFAFRQTSENVPALSTPAVRYAARDAAPVERQPHGDLPTLFAHFSGRE